MGEPTSVPTSGLRQCPTRADGEVVLIAHSITPTTCQDRQRGLYHKCFTCIHRNDRTLAETTMRRLPSNGIIGVPSPASAAAQATNGHANGHSHKGNGAAKGYANGQANGRANGKVPHPPRRG